MEQKDYLKNVTEVLRNAQLADWVEVHTRKMDRTLFEKMQHQLANKKMVSSIVTLTNEISEVLAIETEEHEVTLQSIAYIMVLSNETTPLMHRLFTLYNIIEKMTILLNNQRWGLTCTYPPTNISAMDLYGLSYDKDKLVGSEGWDPSIQAYAKALYQTNQDDSYPKNLTLWFINWQQKFRLAPPLCEQMVYDKEDEAAKKSKLNICTKLA